MGIGGKMGKDGERISWTGIVAILAAHCSNCRSVVNQSCASGGEATDDWS